MSCANSKLEEREFLKRLLLEYRQLPALWKIKSDEYRNRELKNASYDILLAFYRERYTDATLAELKRKLNTLRTNFRTELRNIAASKKSGSGADSVYTPTLWYFGHLLFLKDQEEPDKSISSININDDISINEESSSDFSYEETPQQQPKKKKKQEATDELLTLACERLSRTENEFEVIARAWAQELKSMQPDQQVFVKKAINDVIFEGHMGTLTRGSVVINGPVVQHQQAYYYADVSGENE